MARLFLALALLLAVAAADRCRMGPKSLYPPPASTTIQWVDIDLDKAPQVRQGKREHPIFCW